MKKNAGMPFRMDSRPFLFTAILLSGMTAALGSELTTDNLTVYDDTALHGKLQVSAGYSIPATNLVLYYDFTNNATPVADQSGNNNTGVVNGATWNASGKTVGGAYIFDGTNDFIGLGNPSSLQITGTLTVAMWIKPDQVGDTKKMVAKHGSAGNNGFQLFLQEGEFKMGVSENGTAWVQTSGNTTLLTNTWYHLAGVYDGATLKTYVNGSLDCTPLSHTNGIYNTSANFLLGNEASLGATTYYDGILDEVQTYSRALSGDEIVSLCHHDPLSTDGCASFAGGITYIPPLGDVTMGSYTNQ
jgi:hypothetical protein